MLPKVSAQTQQKRSINVANIEDKFQFDVVQ